MRAGPAMRTALLGAEAAEFWCASNWREVGSVPICQSEGFG
ncbi:MAG TPA: hypothetical protein VMU69_13905 [Bradyrhizobium sp.]|nr:hypothetical protein [Bradyrhizobium sp.]